MLIRRGCVCSSLGLIISFASLACPRLTPRRLDYLPCLPRQVRDAADGAARAIMGQLTAQGVKLILPALLKGVEDKAWRTKQGSIQVRSLFV